MTHGLILLRNREFFEITSEAVDNIMPRTYFVNKDGEVYSVLSGRIMHPTTANTGYQVLNFKTQDGKSRCQLLHRIMMITFAEDPGQLNFVNHKDGNKENNNLGNFEWTNNVGNLEHAQENGLLKTGEDCSWSKLTEKEVREICQHLVDKDYGHLSDLARVYNVHPMTINDIARRITWKEVSCNYDFNYDVRGHFTEDQVHFICKVFATHKDQSFPYCYYYIIFALGLQDERNVRTRILKLYKKDPTAFAYITSQYDY